MKKAIENYEAATKEMDAIDAEFENDLFNEELETKWNEAYKKQFAAFIELANMIVKVTNNQIDMQTAREMINTRFEDIKKLVAAFA
ncbi:MAG: hypothetical protein IK122_00820 [Alphaproteobacteria bacterium]|nr:hypothetical protein [Alphaproteobacteria bacterium]MBR6502592.1 hypothetical protein [Clostridia bacterium]